MVLTKQRKKQTLSMLAIVLLFSTRWMYAQLEIEDKYLVYPAQFIAECIFFALVYSLVVFRVPKAVLLGTAGAGCVSFAVWYGVSAGGIGFLYPFCYLAPLVFLINRLPSEEKHGAVQKVSTVLLWAMPFVFAAAMIASCVINLWKITLESVYYIVVYVAVGVLYRVIPVVAAKHNASGKKGKKHSDTAGNTFYAAGIILVLSCMFLCNEKQVAILLNTVILWILNLLILYNFSNTTISLFVKSIHSKF